MKKKGSPGCPCCCQCVLATENDMDLLNWDNLHNIDDITYQDGVLTFPATGAGILHKKVLPNPYPPYSMSMSMEVKAEEGAILELVLCRDDSTPGVISQFIIYLVWQSCNRIMFYTDNSGTLTEIGNAIFDYDVLKPDVWQKVSVCLDQTKSRVTVDIDDTVWTNTIPWFTSGNKYGLMTPSAGDIQVRKFTSSSKENTYTGAEKPGCAGYYGDNCWCPCGECPTSCYIFGLLKTDMTSDDLTCAVSKSGTWTLDSPNHTLTGTGTVIGNTRIRDRHYVVEATFDLTDFSGSAATGALVVECPTTTTTGQHIYFNLEKSVILGEGQYRVALWINSGAKVYTGWSGYLPLTIFLKACVHPTSIAAELTHYGSRVTQESSITELTNEVRYAGVEVAISNMVVKSIQVYKHASIQAGCRSCGGCTMCGEEQPIPDTVYFDLGVGPFFTADHCSFPATVKGVYALLIYLHAWYLCRWGYSVLNVCDVPPHTGGCLPTTLFSISCYLTPGPIAITYGEPYTWYGDDQHKYWMVDIELLGFGDPTCAYLEPAGFAARYISEAIAEGHCDRSPVKLKLYQNGLAWYATGAFPEEATLYF